jgi:hypothetical protein
VKRGADLNALDAVGKTPIHWALQKKRESTVLLLARAGADLSVVDEAGHTPVECAPEELRQVLQAHLNRRKSGPRDRQVCNSDLFELVTTSTTSPHQVEILLEEGADINALDEHQSTPLCAAVVTDLYDVVKLLIAKGSHIEARDDEGKTPLHWAAIEGHCSVGQLLIAAKADVNVSDPQGETPLHYAVNQSRKEFVRLLMRFGASVDLSNQDLQTPQSLAKGDIKDTIEEFLRVPEVLTPRGSRRAPFEDPTSPPPEFERSISPPPASSRFLASSPPSNGLTLSSEGRLVSPMPSHARAASPAPLQGRAKSPSLHERPTSPPPGEKEMAVSRAVSTVQREISSIIHSAFHSPALRHTRRNSRATEESVVAAVDSLLERVHTQTAQVIERTLSRLDGTPQFPHDEE